MLIPESQIWMIVVGFIVAFILAFGIGANDVANSFGTSVGSKVLTLRQACILATICELAGAILIGAKVSNTIRKGIVDTDRFMEVDNGASVLMAGQVAALGGACIWLLVATFFRLPVSGTHSIVGATVGFSLVIFGLSSIQWIGLIKIDADSVQSTWHSRLGHKITQRIRWKLTSAKSFEVSVPSSVPHPLSVSEVSENYQKEPQVGNYLNQKRLAALEMEAIQSGKQPTEQPSGVDDHTNGVLRRASVGDSIQRHQSLCSNSVIRQHNEPSPTDENSEFHVVITHPPAIARENVKDRPSEAQVFSFLQILSAVFGSFAHGGNDVSNAIGPLIGLWIVGVTQQIDSKMTTPMWILLYGGLGIAVGLWIWGRRVIQTLGEDLTIITPSR
ncbi:Phosphate transporter [Fasciolopsis buskii]|uniref:Phosphate transporter n=1 Tax=Fasciolopsis buskii TaxID=27845 RepID=A0A8E0VGI8_9TREM|nr:Phosphate transporter [Fasciolopsis buski]